MKFQVLSSGSKGNMVYIETPTTKLILDAGISLKKIKERSDINLSEIDGILLTHDHSDHIQSLPALLNKTDAPLYLSENVLDTVVRKFKKINLKSKYQLVTYNKQYKIKDIKIFTIKLIHDSTDCLGYVFASKTGSLAYITDTGVVKEGYFPILQKVDSIILEANHDIELLTDSDRPYVLKQRILSSSGHLSNITSGEILDKILKSKKLNKCVLAHLSEDCNTPDLALKTVKKQIKNGYYPKFYVACQHESLPVLGVKNDKD